jgi:hypothetical protein
MGNRGLFATIYDVGKILNLLRKTLVISKRQNNADPLASFIGEILNRSSHKFNDNKNIVAVETLFFCRTNQRWRRWGGGER